MGYYNRGDYYRGDYYRGDPFLGAIIGGLAKKALPLVGKAASWLTGGKLLGRGGGATAAKKIGGIAATTAVTLPVLRGMPPMTGQPPITMGPLGVDPFSAMPGGQPLFTWGRRKRRRMNVTNVKALKRAIRRAEGFEKIARQTVSALRHGPKKFKSSSRKR